MNTLKKALSALLLTSLLFTLAACTQPEAPQAPATSGGTSDSASDASTAPVEVEKTGVWESAVYFSDREFGSGSKTLTVQVAAEGQAVTFTIHTDKTTLGDAMLEHALLEGENGPYGLYVKRVNGIEADYDKDQTYWSLSIDGGYAMTGVDTTTIEEGRLYRLEKTK